MVLVQRCARIMVVVAGATVLTAAGCGGLRALPVGGNDAAAGGASGSSANAGHGGAGGMVISATSRSGWIPPAPR